MYPDIPYLPISLFVKRIVYVYFVKTQRISYVLFLGSQLC